MTDDGQAVLSTIGDYAEAHEVTAWCERCDRHTPLDLQAISRRYGVDLPWKELVVRLTCSRCGRRPRRVTVSPRSGVHSAQ